MKKIIAMLLCVALVAAMSVSAFAAEKAITDVSKTKVWSVDEWYKWLTGDGKATKTELETYAGLVSAAKAAAQREKVERKNDRGNDRRRRDDRRDGNRRGGNRNFNRDAKREGGNQ